MMTITSKSFHMWPPLSSLFSQFCACGELKEVVDLDGKVEYIVPVQDHRHIYKVICALEGVDIFEWILRCFFSLPAVRS